MPGDVASDDHRIDARFGARPVRAAADHGDVEKGAARHHRPVRMANLPTASIGHCASRKSHRRGSGRTLPPRPSPRHRRAPLPRLEDEVDGPVEIARLSEIPGGRQQHLSCGRHDRRRASPHHDANGKSKLLASLDRQGVHVGAQTHRARPIRRFGQPADDTRLAPGLPRRPRQPNSASFAHRSRCAALEPSSGWA